MAENLPLYRPRSPVELIAEAERHFLNVVALHTPPGFADDLDARSPEQWAALIERFKVVGNSEAAFLSDCDPEVLAEETARRGHQLCAIAFDYGRGVAESILPDHVAELLGGRSVHFKLEALP